MVFPFAAPFTTNRLNQYVGIATPGYENILGAALATNSVTVNGGLADRKGEYFHREISVSNPSQPVWQNVTNIAGTFTNNVVRHAKGVSKENMRAESERGSALINSLPV